MQALTSERVAASTMTDAGVVNRVVADKSLLDEATGFAHHVGSGPTRAHAARTAGKQRPLAFQGS